MHVIPVELVLDSDRGTGIQCFYILVPRLREYDRFYYERRLFQQPDKV